MESESSAIKRIVIIGGVAGGMSAATRLRRLDPTAEITVLERSGNVSFANCGLPYFVGGLIEEEEDLILQTPQQLFERFRLDVHVSSEVIAIHPDRQLVEIRDVHSDEVREMPYDALILSMGAAPVRPPIPGYDRATSLRTVEDAARLAREAGHAATTAVVIGAGFIGLEVTENLVEHGLSVTLVEAAPQVLPPFDPEMAILIVEELEAHGVTVEVGRSVVEVTAEAVILDDGRSLPADVVVGAIGVRPDVSLASSAGLAIGPRGGIAVDDANLTSDCHIYAVGDATEKIDAVSNATSLIALANIANRQGRRVADHIAGLPTRTPPSLGTAIVKVFDLVAASVGWNERRLRETGRNYQAIHSHPFDHATYYPGATRMSAKLIYDVDDLSILGAQIIGHNGVDKRIDVIATAMTAGIGADALADLELAYAPPFSSAKDPVNMLGYMAENISSGSCKVIGADEVPGLVAAGWQLLDVRTREEVAVGAIVGARNVPLDELRENLDSLGEAPIIVYCAVGQRGHTAASLLSELGHEVRNLDGGIFTWRAVTRAAELAPAR